MEDIRKVEKLAMLEKSKRELEEALDMANKANSAKTVFLNSMSHDIRTPMNAIIGFTDLLGENLGDEKKARDYIGKIKSSSDYLLSLINNVLEMARIESGRSDLDERDISVEKSLDAVYWIFEAQIIEQNDLPDGMNIVTNEFHEYRAKRIAKKQGIDTGSIAGSTAWWLLPTYYVREMAGILYEWISG